MVVRKNIYISGSGSIYAMGYLDAHFKPNMSKEECLELVKNGKQTYNLNKNIKKTKEL